MQLEIFKKHTYRATQIDNTSKVKRNQLCAHIVVFWDGPNKIRYLFGFARDCFLKLKVVKSIGAPTYNE